MWFKEYRDYKVDTPLIKEQIEPGRGIIGCEMHDLNGWGDEIHHHRKSGKSFLREFITRLLHRKKRG